MAMKTPGFMLPTKDTTRNTLGVTVAFTPDIQKQAKADVLNAKKQPSREQASYKRYCDARLCLTKDVLSPRECYL